MAYNWFGNTALVTLLSKIKTLTDGKVDKVDGKGLSTNDFTTDEKNKLAGIEAEANKYTLPNATSSTLGGVIVGNGLSVDDTGKVSVVAIGGVQSVNNKTGVVTLTAGDVGAYTKEEVDTKVSKLYRPCGDVATYADLPTEGVTAGDVYNVLDTGKNYAYTVNGTWDDLGGIFDTSGLVAKTDMVEMTAGDVNTAWSGVFGG